MSQVLSIHLLVRQWTVLLKLSMHLLSVIQTTLNRSLWRLPSTELLLQELKTSKSMELGSITLTIQAKPHSDHVLIVSILLQQIQVQEQQSSVEFISIHQLLPRSDINCRGEIFSTILMAHSQDLVLELGLLPTGHTTCNQNAQ